MFIDYGLSRHGVMQALCPQCYDPISLGTLAVTAAGTGYGIYSQKKAQKQAEAAAAASAPKLQPTVTAPVERSPKIMSETERQLAALRLGKGRAATNLTKRKPRTASFVDEGDPVDTAYTNTTLG